MRVKALSRRLFSMSWKIACRPASGATIGNRAVLGEASAWFPPARRQSGGAEQSPRGCMDRHGTVASTTNEFRWRSPLATALDQYQTFVRGCVNCSNYVVLAESASAQSPSTLISANSQGWTLIDPGFADPLAALVLPGLATASPGVLKSRSAGCGVGKPSLRDHAEAQLWTAR